jgi:uncharacterized metal-binding protein
MKKKVVILPCSGIGKAYGEMGRQAIYELIEDLGAEEATTTCLARLMIDDPGAKGLVQDNMVITVDGCARDCARKNVEFSGKKADSALRVIDVFKDHRDLKPEGILELGEPGFKLVHMLAQKLKEEVGRVRGKEKEDAGPI